MIFGGVVLLIVALIALLVLREQRGRLDALGSAGLVACDAVVEDQVCAVFGRAEAHEGHALKAPASGRPCVWFRLTVIQWWWDTSSADGGVTTAREIEDRTPDGAVFVLRDSGGQILVNAEGADIDRPVESFSERHPVEDFGGGALEALVSSLDRKRERPLKDEELEIQEWILPVDEELYVRGKPCRTEGGLTMIDPDDDHFVISTRSRDALTRSEKRWAAGATTVGAVAAAGGVALIVAGALA